MQAGNDPPTPGLSVAAWREVDVTSGLYLGLLSVIMSSWGTDRSVDETMQIGISLGTYIIIDLHSVCMLEIPQIPVLSTQSPMLASAQHLYISVSVLKPRKRNPRALKGLTWVEVQGKGVLEMGTEAGTLLACLGLVFS